MFLRLRKYSVAITFTDFDFDCYLMLTVTLYYRNNLQA